MNGLLTPQASPALAQVVVALVAGVLAAAWPGRWVWPRLRMLVTIVHEGGHALVGVLFGRRLTAIRLNHDSSGVTETWGRARGLGVVATTFAGYPFPAFVAAVLLRAAVSGWSRTAAAAIALVLLVMLAFARNVRGVLVLLLAVAAAAAAARWLASAPLTIILCLLSGVWLAGAGRTLLEERHARRRGAPTDLTALARHAVVPAPVWWLLMWLPVGYAGWVMAGAFAVA